LARAIDPPQRPGLSAVYPQSRSAAELWATGRPPSPSSSANTATSSPLYGASRSTAAKMRIGNGNEGSRAPDSIRAIVDCGTWAASAGSRCDPRSVLVVTRDTVRVADSLSRGSAISRR
jgi:hypothetical protein